MSLWSKGVRAPSANPALVGLAALFKGQPKPCKPCEARAEAKAAGGADKNRGGAETLRRYWVRGVGAAKVGWGTPGDFDRCVALLTEHMGARAKGYCNLRHHDATGTWPGDHKAAPRARDVLFPPVGKYDYLITGVKAGGENGMPDGVMVALYAPDDVAAAHSVDGGTAPSDMHVTLAYLGKVDEVGDPTALMETVAKFAADTDPVDGEVSGVGRFTTPDGDAVYLSVDAPTLPEMRAALVAAVEEAGYEVRKNHGFTPHITLTYVDADEDSPISRVDPASTQFGLLSVAYGPDVWDFPMGASE